MQVAVTGVEDVGHDEVVPAGDVVDAGQDVHEHRARHDAIVQVVVGCDLGDRPERALPPLPQQGPFGLIGGHADVADAVVAGGALHRAGLRIYGLGEAVHLHDEDRRRVGRVPGVGEGLSRHDDAVVHHLHGCGHDATGDYGGD